MTSYRPDSSPPEPTHRLADALEELPLFPLPEVVLFPRSILPLHVFEPRYRAMLKASLRSHGALAIVQLPTDAAPAASPKKAVRGPAPSDDHAPIARVAGAGLVIECEPLPDGRANILVQGIARVRLEELPFESPFRRARATLLDEERDVLVPDSDVAALFAAASSFANEVKRRDPHFSFRLPDLRSDQTSPGALADACAFHLVISAKARQAMLEDLDPRTRVLRVLEELSAQRLELHVPGDRGKNGLDN